MEREFGEVAPILSMLLRFYHEKGMLMGQVAADVSSSALRAMARTAATKAEFPEAQSRALTYVNEIVAYMVNRRGADPDQTFTREMLKWDVYLVRCSFVVCGHRLLISYPARHNTYLLSSGQ